MNRFVHGGWRHIRPREQRKPSRGFVARLLGWIRDEPGHAGRLW
jgi:hypothetical protein